MMVYFDNLYWRSAGTLGYESVYLKENDTGPDDAVHSEYGVLSLYIPSIERSIYITSSIYDFAPTVLELLRIKSNTAFHGKSLLKMLKEQ